MPNETLIAEIERILSDVVELGAAAERTRMVPNLLVTDAAPTGLTGFITVKDDRDGDNILARTIPSIIYSTNDLVNVLFIRGGEAIAFQQASQSPNAGMWTIVPSTSTDIFFNKGDVGIGKSVAPDARLELLDTAQAQLRLTHTEDTVFADFTLDSGDDLTIKTSSTGNIIFQPTTDSTTFFQVLDTDGGTPVLNVDSTNERVGIGNNAPTTPLDVTGAVTITDEIIHAGDTDNKIGFTDDVQTFTVGGLELLKLTEAAQDLINIGPGSGDVDVDINGDIFLRGSDGVVGIGTAAPAVGPLNLFGLHIKAPSGAAALFVDGAAGNNAIYYMGNNGSAIWHFQLNSGDYAIVETGVAVQLTIEAGGNVGIGTTAPLAQLDIDQASTTAAIPVLILDQADVSEEMVEFVSTIGTGNAIEAVGAKTLTVTHFIKVTLPGSLTRYIEVGTIA